MRRSWLACGLVLLAVVAVGCSDERVTVPALAVPKSATLVATIPHASGKWNVFRGPPDCLWLQTTVGDRAEVSDPVCRNQLTLSSLTTTDTCVRFNDRTKSYPKVAGDLGNPCDAYTDTQVIWGDAPPEAGYVCAATPPSAVVARPDAEGTVLLATATSGDRPPDVVALLPDGRAVGGPAVPSTMAACRAAAGLDGISRPEPVDWRLRFDFAPELAASHDGFSLRTSTGHMFAFANYGQFIGPNHPLPPSIALYPDTASITITPILESPSEHYGTPQTFDLPAPIHEALNGDLPCDAQPPLLIRVRADSTIEVTNDPAC
jgi:hypothetical protein